MLNSLVKSVCPEFPSDRQVRATGDKTLWYKIPEGTCTLYVPPVKLLKVNMVLLNQFIEAVSAFAIRNININDLYDWDNLYCYTYQGDECAQGIKELQKAMNDLVASDIETKGVMWEGNKLLAIGFAVSKNTSYAFYNIPEELYSQLTKIYQNNTIKFIWHNGKFDCSRLKYLCNIDARIDHDTMLEHYVGINETKGTHGLKDLGSIYLQAPPWDDELDNVKRNYCKEHGIKLKEFTYDLIPTSILIPYLHKDTIATYRLHMVFQKLMRPESQFIYSKLIEASNAYKEVELNGMRIDLEYLEDLEYDLEQRLKVAQETLDAVASRIWDPFKYSQDTGAKCKPNEKFNIKSPKQLKWMLQRVLGYPVPSTRADVIEGLQEEVASSAITNKDAVDFLSVIGDVRKISKYMDTYISGFRDSLCNDMRIRGTFNLHGTETGRLSSSNPNMQNIPRDKTIKNLITCTPGYKLVQMDYSQAELRVLAILSGDPWLTKVYQEDKDLHDAVATDMFGPDFNKEQRVMAKTINFGIAYGRGPGSIARTFNKTMSEARAIIDKWYGPMPKVKEYINNRRAMASRGEKCITPFGRERHFIVTNDNLNHIQNEYINTPIQSLASDFTMFSLVEIDKYRKESKIDFNIVTTVHDSIILEVIDDSKIIDEVVRKCTQIMATTPKKYLPEIKVPFKADAEVGYSYGKLEEWKPCEV